MKSTINSLVLIFVLVFLEACIPMQVQLSILNLDNKYIQIKNGNKEIFWGFTGSSNMTNQNLVVIVPIKFNDSLSLKIRDNNNLILNRSYKLTRGKYLYIDNLTGEFSVYSQKKEKAIY